MKEFITAVEDVVLEDEREAQIAALMEKGKTRAEAEVEVDEDPYVEFKIDDRVMRAYRPNEGQLIFLLASLGRGQSKESRMASIVNIMMESLREEDKDYFESRLLSRSHPIAPKTIEAVFEHLTEEWFARPTKP